MQLRVATNKPICHQQAAHRKAALQLDQRHAWSLTKRVKARRQLVSQRVFQWVANDRSGAGGRIPGLRHERGRMGGGGADAAGARYSLGARVKNQARQQQCMCKQEASEHNTAMPCVHLYDVAKSRALAFDSRAARQEGQAAGVRAAVCHKRGCNGNRCRAPPPNHKHTASCSSTAHTLLRAHGVLRLLPALTAPGTTLINPCSHQYRTMNSASSSSDMYL